MLVSVVVPVYKVERYLENCIKSILNQSFKDFELILVDDGSPDNCGELCDFFARKDPRIRVVHQKNGGLSKARNSGIDIATGDYLTFIDSDDFVFPNYLEILVKTSVAYGADLSVCGYCRCKENDSMKTIEESLHNSVELFHDDKMNVFFTTKKIGTTAWGKLYKKKLFKHLRFPIGRYNEDAFTTYLTIHEANLICVCSYIGYVYRENEQSIMNESYSMRKMDSVDASVERALFIEKNYPDLTGLAYRSIIYSCNQIILSMGRAKICDVSVLRKLQPLYRKYWRHYIFKRSSIIGKFFAFGAFLNVKIPLWFVNYMGL
ncbi:glycosyltransferase family 2 protein [Fibrobacter sp. UWB10]|uniref:glycosyltransferase family 2 protein n=1 Tax=Fibrobacter sp. UWB10 TaxID=1896201 RepID=UPI002403144A|nr:glycosyltransferase family 2 protein [Fibrobacter sp. UWB10]SMP47318.1 Glycosyl transferase family 2 [Fibrobacter sp. UWB10]